MVCTSWKRTAPLYDVGSAQGAGSAEGLLPRGGGGGLRETKVPQYKNIQNGGLVIQIMSGYVKT